MRLRRKNDDDRYYSGLCLTCDKPITDDGPDADWIIFVGGAPRFIPHVYHRRCAPDDGDTGTTALPTPEP